MKILSKYRSTTLIIIIISNYLSAQEHLSFSDAQNLMLTKNKEVFIENKKVEMEEKHEKIARSYRFPHFSAFGIATVMDKDITMDLNGTKNKVATLLELPDPSELGDWNFTIQKKDMEFAGVSMTWPIFTGGKINAANKAAKINSEISKNEQFSSEQSLISELVNRYYKAKLAEEAVKVRQQVYDGMNKHLYNSQKLEENGIIAGVESLQAKVAVSDAERQLLAAKKDFELAQIALANTLEVEDATFQLVSPFFVDKELESLSYYQNQASANYPQIQKLKLLEQLTEESIKAEKSSYLPNIALTGQKIFASNNFPLVKTPLIVGASLNYDLFDGFARKNKIAVAKTQKEIVVLTREKAEADIKTYITKFYNELKKYEEQINSLDVTKSLAEELVRVRTKSFSEGMTSSIDVIDAELNLYSVKLQMLKAYCDYDTTLAQLFELCGISNNFSSKTN